MTFCRSPRNRFCSFKEGPKATCLEFKDFVERTWVFISPGGSQRVRPVISGERK